jgi:hypothetical protein
VLFNYSVPLFQYGYHAWNPVDGPLNYVAVVLLGFPYTILSPLLFLWVFWGSRKRANSPLSNLRFPLALAMSAAFIVFVLQEKGWRYHLIPQVLLTWVLILVMFVDDTAPGIYRDARITIQIRAFVAIAIAAPMLLLYVVNIATHPGIHSEIEAVIRAQTNPDDKVLIIHTEVHEWYGVYVRTRHLAASRYLTGFPIALIYANERDQEGTSPYHTPQEYSDFEVRYLTELAADIQENRPPLIFVQTRCQKCPAGFLVNEYIEGAEPLQAVMDNYIAFGEFDHSDLTSLIGYCLVGVDCEP